MDLLKKNKTDNEIYDYIESHLDSDIEKILNGEEINMGNKAMPKFNIEGVYLSLMSEIKAKNRRKTIIATIRRWAVAAVVAVIAGLSAFYFNTLQSDKAVAINDIYARKGEKVVVILSDGSRVSLNADTHLYYPDKFCRDTREVRVEGEAYFEVSKDKSKPFIVKAHDMQIQVTGTKFNISAYPESKKILTTLDEGCVLVGKDSTVTTLSTLHPGDCAEYSRGTAECKVKRIKNPLESSGWKNNIFVFRDAPIDEVLAKLERTYDVSFTIGNEKIKSYTYNLICPTTDMKEVMKIIETITPVKFMKVGDYEYELK